jgi:hypothetical protein
MTMTAERSGRCSTAVAPLELVEEVLEDWTELVPEAEDAEEVDTGNCVSVKQSKKVTQKDGRDHLNMSPSEVVRR